MVVPHVNFSSRAAGRHRKPRRRTALALTATLTVAAAAAITGIVGADATPGARASYQTPTWVQSARAHATDGTALTATLTSPAAAGDLLVVYAAWNNQSPAQITDSADDRFGAVGPNRVPWGDGLSSRLVFARNIAGGSTSVTVRFAAGITAASLHVQEYTGVSRSRALDGSASATGTGTTLDSGPITTDTPGELIVGAGAADTVDASAGAGFQSRASGDGGITEDEVADDPGAYSATATHRGGDWVMTVAAFRPQPVHSSDASTTPTSSPTDTSSDPGTPTDPGTTTSPTSPTTSPTTAPTSPTTTPPTTSTPTSPGTTPTSTSPGTTPPTTTTSSSSSPTPTPTSTAPSTQSCPAYPSFPDASCTGVPAGTDLTVVSGDQSFGSASNGQTISNKDFRGFVVVTGANITFKNCWFRGRNANGENHALVDTEGSAGPITIMDSTLAPAFPAPTIDDLALRNANLYRDDISGGVDGMKADSNTLVEDSYIHDMTYFDSDPNQGGGPTHNDGVQTFAGESHITLRHNTIDLSGTYDSNSAWQDSGTDARAEYNYLDGGGCTLNFAAQVLNGATLTPIYVNNNHFGRHQGFTGCVALISLKAVMTQYIGNVWQDTGAAVPAPQQHD